MRRLGALEPDEIERLFRAADVFAFPSVKEGFGLAALEALAAGLPLVASDIDVFRGFLTDGAARCCTRWGMPRRWPPRWPAWPASPRCASACARGGAEVVAGFGWDASGAAHEAAYERVGSMAR